MSRSLTDRELKNQLQEMGDYDFEHFVADLWEQQGWRTEVEQQSNDAGVDVRAIQTTPYRQKQLIQAKRYSSSTKVGGPDIQQYYGLKDQEQGVDSAIIVTTSSFTRSAKQRADELNVKLVNGDDLVEMVHTQGAYSLLDEYIDINDHEPGLSHEEPEQQHEFNEGTKSDQIQVWNIPFLDIEYPKGATSEEVDLTKTWRYYTIWGGIFMWVLIVALDALFVIGPAQVTAVFLTPIGIMLDSSHVEALDWTDSDWLLLIVGSAIPILGVIPTAVYLTHRRAMRLDLNQQLRD